MEAEKRARTNPQNKGRQPLRPTRFTKNQKQSIVLFGDFYVERAYLDSFFALLQETIAFHMAAGTRHEENVKQLPTHTYSDERRAMLEAYITSESKKGIDITRKEVARRADVDYSVLVKWTNGKIVDTSPPGIRISLLLRFDERNRARSYHKRSEPD
jgi:hypothetical protein